MPNQTGPTTPEGKHNSSLNHLQHGATSKSLLLPNEDPADYMRLLESAFAQYEPATENDAGIVAQCIHTQWLLLRRQRAADFVEVDLYARNPEPTNWSAEDFATMNRLDMTVSSIQTMRLNITSANSRIRDVDVAEETSSLSKQQVLSQAGVSVLAQANQLPQLALSLLRGGG